mgnify:CR=1 FL=1
MRATGRTGALGIPVAGMARSYERSVMSATG